MQNVSKWSSVCVAAGEMSLDIHSCRPDELERLIPLLDGEFIFGKGRSISLQRRFPSVYCGNNLANILLCTDGEAIVSALAMRHFDWREGNEIFRGAMIGAVYTHPARRGEGLASQLLAAAANQLRENKLDFGVLWTGQPSFYARLGWKPADTSLVGKTELDHSAMPTSNDVVRMSISAGAPLAEKIRQSKLSGKAVRHTGDYQQLPLPAECVDFLWHANQGKAAYALLGTNGGTGFLYELIGDISSFPALWDEICRGRERLFINDQPESASHHWLADHTDANWENKNLAMWLPLSRRVNMARLEQWHIPYFDRI